MVTRRVCRECAPRPRLPSSLFQWSLFTFPLLPSPSPLPLFPPLPLSQVRIQDRDVEPYEVEDVASNEGGVLRCLVTLRASDPGRQPYLAAYLLLKSHSSKSHHQHHHQQQQQRHNHPIPDSHLGRSSNSAVNAPKPSVAASASEHGQAVSRKVRESLLASLPPHCVPAAITVVDHLPVTRLGTADRTRLPPPPIDSFYISREEEASLWASAAAAGVLGDAIDTPEERAVAVVFSEVLPGVEAGRLRKSSNFFELGGHSQSALHVIGRLQEQYAHVAAAAAAAAAGGGAGNGAGATSGKKDGQHDTLAARLSRKKEAVGPVISVRGFFDSPTVGGVAESIRRRIERREGEGGGSGPAARGRDGTAGGGGGGLPASGSSGVQLGYAEFKNVSSVTGGRQVGCSLSEAQMPLWVLYHVAPNPRVLDICDVWRLQVRLKNGNR